jgi:DivIVA domain-containing protein
VTLLQILVVLAVVAAVAAVAAGVWRGGPVDAHDADDELGLPEPTTTVPPVDLPAGRFTADDIDGLHFSLGLRGYRMDEVDQVLDRIAGELRSRDAEVALLREQAARRMAGVGPATGSTGAGDDTDDGATDDDADDDAAEDSVVASTEGSVAGFGGFGTAAGDRSAPPDAREP